MTIQGFGIRHPYVTVDGFDITGYVGGYTGHITIYKDGSFCRILNNTIRDGASNTYGILFYSSRGLSANNCVVRGNRISNLSLVFLATNGSWHLFENNLFEYQNSMDYLRVFGHDQIFRRNIFNKGIAKANTGNHPDWVQTFGNHMAESYNMLFEENWIQDLESQMGQLNSGGSGIVFANIHDYVFRRNVFVNISNNMNGGLPGMQYVNNTFYRLAYTQSGLGSGGSLTRGDASRFLLRNNAFVAGSYRQTPNQYGGYYVKPRGALQREVLTKGGISDPLVVAGIFADMVANGYLNPNGILFPKAQQLNDISQFTLDANYNTYKPLVYDLLARTIALDKSMIDTFSADYDFVAGWPSAGFPAAKDFNESHGVNGGDPKFACITNPLGSDGVPFTNDDGLIPLPDSPLCGKGEGGTDIGALPCGNPPANAICWAPSIVNGQCGQTRDTCLLGTFNDVTDTSANYLWKCVGSLGGTTADCSLPKQTGTNDFNVSKQGSGTGTITSSPSGINCGTDCNQTYTRGTQVTLTALPASDSNFAGWSLQNCTGTLPCTVIMDSNINVTATFGKTNLTMLDSDNDGVPDSFDRCPNTKPAIPRNFISRYGCPIPLSTRFNIKPDFNAIDITNITNFEIGITGTGKIAYPNNPINLVLTTGGQNSQPNLDNDINITNGKITIEPNIPSLNQSATVTLYNITVANPKIMKNGAACTQCTIQSYDRASKTLVFTVPGF